MSTSAVREEQQSTTTYGWYVYGIVERDVEVLPDTHGIGDPPSPIQVVRSGDVAALVSRVSLDRPIGHPDDLMAHERLLDAVVVDAAVLPVRFGAVLASRDAVAQELLSANEEQFASALRSMSGKTQYVVRARYVEEILLPEVLEENPTAVELAGQLRDRPEEATRDVRLQLGELVNNAVEAKREEDTRTLLDALAPVSVATAVRPATHEQDAAHVAVLVENSRAGDLDAVLNELARDWAPRATVRVLGPMAPYDFVVTTDQTPEG